jgi:RNA polymerase sigma factor (sigma-70 family)
MKVFQLARPHQSQSATAGEESCDYLRLITDNLAYIENQCRRAVLRTSGGDDEGGDGIQLDNQADELLNEVLDRLKADGCRALREFKGKAKLTTYITTIISNLIIDLVRQKKGRSRARERAREMGAVAERLYDLVYARGCSLIQAHSCLEITHGIHEPLERLQEMLQRMRGRERLMPLVAEGESTWLVPGRKVVVDDEPQLVVADPRKDAEAELIVRQRESRARTAVAGLVAGLSGEERLLIALRFPQEEEEPKSTREIGELMGLSEKCVDAKIRRILLRCRQDLLGQGLRPDDLIDR